jgi:hypothetical protein
VGEIIAMSEIQSEDQQLIVLLQNQIIELRQQCELKDKQIARQAEIIRSIQRAVGAGSFPPSR